MHQSREKGFTLAELLIALALLGVIAAFTIPKVLQATGNSENSAKVKEAVSTLESGWYNLKMQNAFTPATTLWQNLTNPQAGATLNTQAQGQGVASTILTGQGGVAHPCAAFTGYVQFANGVVIAGLDGGGTGTTCNIPADLTGATATRTQLLCIDVNGNAPPNVNGSDIFYGNFSPAGDFGLGTPGINAKNFYWGTTVPSTGFVYKDQSNSGGVAGSAQTMATQDSTTSAADRAGFFLGGGSST